LKKENLANVRSAIAVTIAAVVLLVAAAPASARVVLVLLPQGTSMDEVAAAGMSPGLMSAGLGPVPAEQTYLDIGQGNRVFDSLYDSDLSRAQVPLNRPVTDSALLRRAESAPAEIVPGLLARTLWRAGRGFEVRDATAGELRHLVGRQRGNDLLIAIERPPPAPNRTLAIGVAGKGFDGNLTSDSTRLDGYVLSTDIAPTILDHFGLEVPSQMSGEPIRAEGETDPAAVDALGDRMAVIADRRGPVIGLSLLVWVVVLGLLAGLARGGVARAAVRVVGLAVVYVPLLLLVGAALEPGEMAEMLLLMLGAPALAGLTLALLHGYRALAAAAALTVLACAVDMVAGSPLTALSLMGPNPGLGVRFYGIGNELEAPLAVLVVAGTGAGLAGFAPRLAPRPSAAVFLAVGLLAAFVFAAGRFGAAVGAAIVMPVGAAAAAAAIAARRRRAALLVVAAPFAAVALLALVDLLSGANAHLTRSVLDAGGLHDLGDVAERRLRLSAHSLLKPLTFVFLPLVALLVALAVARRDRLRAWLEARPQMRAGLIGAVVATVVGALANDSGALLLEIGAAYLLVFVGFAWAESGPVREVGAGR
jgi:hypothetical protein